jgi:hypothetical protein
MAQPMTGAVTAEESEITKELVGLNSALETVMKNIEELNVQLQGICSPMTPSAKPSAEETALKCSMSHTLRQLANMAFDANNLICDIKERLQL